MSRPYFQYSLAQLKQLYADGLHNAKLVEAIKRELAHRRTHAAKAFLKEISGSSASPTKTTPAPPSKRPLSAPRNGPEPFRLTDEQEIAVRHFQTAQSLKVTAFAGAGKTSTLAAMARSTSRSGLYLAFNRAIAQDAKKAFPRSVDCRTTHSLAFHSVKGQFPSSGKLVDSLNGNAVAQLLNLELLQLKSVSLQPRSLGTLVLRTLRHFCYSDGKDFLRTHIPRWGKLAALSDEERATLDQFVLLEARRLWSKMLDPNDRTPLGHDGYLKLWALTEPNLSRDYILLDEAQDTNEVVLGVLRRQNAQTVYVGDAHQQIYEWRGAVNAMEQIETANDSYLTMSFRFGDTIAQAANRILYRLGETKPLKGNPDRTSYIGTLEYDACLSRTNAMLINELLHLLGTGKRPCVVGGIADLERLLEGVMLLQSGKPSDVPELFGFGNWDEVRQAVRAEEGHELTMLVNLVERFSAVQLLASLRRTESEESKANVVLSTVHKAKGREWNRVHLTDDFVVQKKSRTGGATLPIAREELRIAYVAVTRAKVAVNIPPEIRNAFGIIQDSKYDRIRSHQSQSQIPPPKPKATIALTSNSNTHTSETDTASASSNKSGDGWLARIRDFFR